MLSSLANIAELDKETIYGPSKYEKPLVQTIYD